MGTSRHRVNDDSQADPNNRSIHVPAKYAGQDNRRGIDCDSRRKTPLDKKNHASQSACFRVEPMLQEFIHRTQLELVIHGYKNDGDQDKGQRHAKVVLHKGHSAVVGQARSRKEGDRTGLGSHYR